jgi:hypothetical protein
VKDIARSVGKRWAAANPEKIKASRRKWERANPARCVELCARRTARKKGATPVLSNIERTCLRVFYDTARFLKEITGETFHVDHVIPLSKGGLHHPRNLQVLRGVDNLRKGARV